MRQPAALDGDRVIRAALLVVATSLGLGPANAWTEGLQARPGERVRVGMVSTTPGGTVEDELEGVLRSIEADGLTVLADDKAEAIPIPASAIRRLELSRGKHRPGWAIPTLVLGGALAGALTGGLFGGYSECNPGYCSSDEEVESSARTGAWIGAAVGGVGGLIGALFIRQERWEPALLPAWAQQPKVSLGLMPVRRGVGLRVTVAF